MAESLDQLPETPWASDAPTVLHALAARPSGLTEAEVAARRERFGPNELRHLEKRSLLQILGAQLRSAVVWLLLAAAGVSFAFGELAETLAILGVVVLNTALGFVTEWRASRSMEALRELGAVRSTVRRADQVDTVDARELVPGDVVLLEAGDVVTADLRLLEASAVTVDESILTGESVPVDKGVDPVAREAQVNDRRCMLHKGTTLTRGRAEALVTHTGSATELGRIGALVAEATERDSPLQRRLETLGRQLMGVTLVLAFVVMGLGVIRGQELLLMLQAGIALAVAAVPEGLPVVATLSLARGMWRLARRNVLVEHLGAVETLGSTNVVLTDKTGTLTENRMRAAVFLVAEGRVEVPAEGSPASRPAEGPLASLLAVAAGGGEERSEGRGEPMEQALVDGARAFGVDRAALLAERPCVERTAFDPELRMSATHHRLPGGGTWVAVKGAPESVIERSVQVLTAEGPRPLSDADRRRWLERNQEAAGAGLRMLALAEREGPQGSEGEDPYERLVLLGLVGLHDPPRSTVAPALARARSAGVRVVMATGDQAATASAIARAAGVAEEPRAMLGAELRDDGPDEDVLGCDVIARATPEHKLRLLRLHQRAGAVVAMLGDGVNDAPALRQADIGVAMGQRGTAVARQAADMVLEDDDLGSVIVAIAEGRVIFGNLRAFVVYLLGCNLAELLIIALAMASGLPLPLLPLQLLYLNLITDVFPAAALGAGEGDGTEMDQPPRARSEPFLTRRHWTAIVAHAAALTAAVLAVFAVVQRLGYGVSEATTVAFATLGFAQLWHAFDMASPDASPFRNGVTRNPWIWAAVVLCCALLVAGLRAPGLGSLLGVVPLDGRAWLLALGASLAPLLCIQTIRALRRAAGA